MAGSPDFMMTTAMGCPRVVLYCQGMVAEHPSNAVISPGNGAAHLCLSVKGNIYIYIN